MRLAGFKTVHATASLVSHQHQIRLIERRHAKWRPGRPQRLRTGRWCVPSESFSYIINVVLECRPRAGPSWAFHSSYCVLRVLRILRRGVAFQNSCDPLPYWQSGCQFGPGNDESAKRLTGSNFRTNNGGRSRLREGVFSGFRTRSPGIRTPDVLMACLTEV